MCRLCIFLSVDCVVVVSLFIAAPIVYVGFFSLGGDCVVVTLFIAAPIVYVGHSLSWAVIVLLL